ncbi:hypothetical protein MON38_20995 [Hymenobacter sp. DH14]|uniref:Uncharacterized protein n=1 Tax=Hymenobacter cyanobacteriorum TaxID=2926463 RepID=A0A9X2AIF1_9BACT|nr:hypothetical protein [Hymenobacter cyanobacteriorum]MCI1189908.1 hypothetical protein [Hymenobacter cyanobacteriorum]
MPALAKKPFFKSKVFKATIVPAVLIGYGISTIHATATASTAATRAATMCGAYSATTATAGCGSPSGAT